MLRDRRPSTRSGPGRRRSMRSPDYVSIWWQQVGSDDARRGWLVERSKHGLALLTENPDSPPVGATITPGNRLGRSNWLRPAMVTRVTPLSDLLDLVAAEYLDAPVDERRHGDRRFDRREERGGRIDWHVDGSRGQNAGWLSDQSPSSLTFVTATRVAPRRGEAIRVVGPKQHSEDYEVTRTAAYDQTTSLIACRATNPSSPSIGSRLKD